MCDDRHQYCHRIPQHWLTDWVGVAYQSTYPNCSLAAVPVQEYLPTCNSHFNCFYDHRQRGSITKIFVKKDSAPIQTTHSFLHVLCWFLFVPEVENEIFTYTSINISLVSSIEAKKCSINKGLKNRKIRHKVLLYSRLKIRALNKNEFWRKFRSVSMYTIVNCHWIHCWSLIFEVLNFSLKAAHQYGCFCP